MNNVMTKTQQKFASNNYPLMVDFINRRIAAGIVPPCVEDDFKSDTAWYFCKSVLGFDKKMGFKFSTYAYGGFDMCWKNIKARTEQSYRRHNFCSRQIVEYLIDKSFDSTTGTPQMDTEMFAKIINESNLTARELMVLQEYFCSNQSMQSVGVTFAVSRERISQVIKKIIRKLRRTADRLRLQREDFYME